MKRLAINVQHFGAVLTATATQTRRGFERALAHAASRGKGAIYVPSRSTAYTFDAPITVNNIAIIGESLRGCTLNFPDGSVAGAGHAITLLGGGDPPGLPHLKNLHVKGPSKKGPSKDGVLGTLPANFNGIRYGTPADNTGGPITTHNCYVEGFEYGLVLDSTSGHIHFSHVGSKKCYYGLYVRRSTADYSFRDCNFAENRMAGVGLPRNTGLDMALFDRCHFGYAPYGFHQSNLADAGTGDKHQGFLVDCDLLACNFESIGNSAYHSEAAADNGGRFWSNHIYGGWSSYNAAYKLAANNADYWVNVPDAEGNHIHWWSYPWPSGDVSVAKYGGNGKWYIYGDAAWPAVAGTASFVGDTTFNRLLNTEFINATAQINSDATFVDFTYNEYQKSAASAFLPIVTPRANPGSHWWISNLTSTGFRINLASAAPTNVPFNVHLQS
jgi:hypothetical protein